MLKYPLERKKYTRQYHPRPRLVEAYFYFYDMIKAYIEAREGEPEPDAENTERRIDALVNALTNYLEVVTIELEGDDDPQVIFETLNARGEPLLPSDLIRNFVFLEAQRQKEDVEGLYNTYWRPYDGGDNGSDTFWKVKVTQGRLVRPRIDLFFFHYLSYRVEHELLITHLFQEFRDWWLDHPRTVKTELEVMQFYSKVFRNLFEDDQSAHSRLSVFARRLRLLDTSTVYPFLLFLLGENKDSISHTDRDAILVDIESYLIRRMICGLTTKNYNRVFPQLLRQMRKAETVDHATIRNFLSDLKDPHTPPSGTDVRTRVRRFFMDLQGDSVRWPTDTEFRDAWLSNPIYQKLTARRVSMVLEALDLQLITAKQEQVHLSGELSIEHVMPQHGSMEDWPLQDEPTWGEDPQEYRGWLIHTFGNLTLLTQRLNSGISNGPFLAKRPEIAMNSNLRMNAYFQDFKGKPWTEQSILDRGEHLFEIAKAIWPGPDTTNT